MRTRIKQESIVIRLEGSLTNQTTRDKDEIDRTVSELKSKGYEVIHPKASKKTGYKVLTLTGVRTELES